MLFTYITINKIRGPATVHTCFVSVCTKPQNSKVKANAILYPHNLSQDSIYWPSEGEPVHSSLRIPM